MGSNGINVSGGVANNENINQLTFNQIAQQNHQQQLDSNIFYEQMIAETIDQSPMQQYLKIGNGSTKKDMNRKNQFGSSLSNSSNKRLSGLKQSTLQKQANMFKTQETNEELPLLTGFILESQQIPPINNAFNKDKKQTRQESYNKSRHRSVLQTSDPVQLQILREVLERKESPDPGLMPNNKLKNQIQFSSLQNEELHRAQQLQAVGGMLLKQQPELFFNGRNSQQQNVLLQNNNPLVQSMKTGASSQASFIHNPRVTHNIRALYDASRFNTDSDTDFEGYMSAAGGGGRGPSVFNKNYQIGRLQQQDSIISNNGLKLPISKSMHQLKNSPTLASATSQQQHHMNYVGQQQQQMDIDKSRLLQQIDQLIQKKRIARELEVLDGSNYLQKLQQYQKSQSPPLNFEIQHNYERNEVPSQRLMQVYDPENQLYNTLAAASDYQSQIGSSYPQYLLEQKQLNGLVDTQSVYLPKTQSRNHFQGGAASASLQQLQRGANLYQSEIYQPNYISMHPQILLEDGGFNQQDENFPLYQQQAIQDQLLRNAQKNHQYLTLQNLPQNIINKQDDMRTLKVHQILGSASHKHRRQSLINEEISEREEIALEFAQEEKEDTPTETRYSKFKPDSKHGKKRTAGNIMENHIIDDMSISPIETEHRPSLKDPKSAPLKAALIRNSPQNQEPSTQLDTRYTSTRGEGNVGMSQNLQIKAQIMGEEQVNNNNRRNTVDSTSTDDRDIRLLKDQINEGLKRSAEYKMAQLQQIKIPIFDDQISTGKNNINIGEQNQTSNSHVESSHIPITVVITRDQDMVFPDAKHINKQQINEDVNSTSRQQDQINLETLDQGGSQETADIIHNTSPTIFKNQYIRNSPQPVTVNQFHNNQEENKERKQIQPKNSNSSTLLSLPNNPLLQFKDSGHRASDISSAKTYMQILNENEAKELNDLEKLLKKVDKEESIQNKKLSYGVPAAAKNKLAANNQAKHLSKKSSIKNPKEDNQSYESFSEKFNSSRRASLHNSIISKSRENVKQSPQATPVAYNANPGRDSIQIEMTLNPKLLDTVSDATPLQKSPVSKSEVRGNNDSPEIIRSLLNRGSIIMVSNVMSLNIVREDPIVKKNSQNSNRNGSNHIKIEEESKKSSGKIEITRMPYGMAKNKVKDSEETVQNRRKSCVEDQSRLRGNISPKPFVDNNEMMHDRYQPRKLSNQQLSKHEEFPITSPNHQHHQPKTLIVLKNNVNGPDQHSQISENIPLPAPQAVTTITMLAPTIDAILDPIIQEIVQNNTAPPPQEKVFKRGRNARGKSMFAQNILFKLSKPRKQLDPEEVERMLMEKEKEDKDLELQELKVQSQSIPKPPKGKRRYVDYLIKQNETSRPESRSNDKIIPQLRQSAQKLSPKQVPKVPQNELKTTTFSSQFSFRIKEAMNFRKSLESNNNLKGENQEVRKESDFNLEFEQVTNPITIKESQNDFNTSLDQTPYLRNASRSPPQESEIIIQQQQYQEQQPQVKQQGAVILTSSLKRGMTNKASSFLKKQQTVKFFTPEQQEIAIPQQLVQNFSPEMKQQDSRVTFTTLAIAKVPQARQTYGAKPKMSEVRLAITPYVESGTTSPLLGPDQDHQKATTVPQQKISDIKLTHFAPQPNKRESEMRLTQFGPKNRESNSNLGQLGSIAMSVPTHARKPSTNKLAPPEFKHSNIDVQIIQTTLDTTSAINKEKQLRKTSSNKIQNLNFNKVMKDLSDPIQLGSDRLESDQRTRNYQSLGTFNQGLTSQRTSKGSTKQLIMPKSHSSKNFLMTQQSLYQEPQQKHHPEAPLVPKTSNKVLPKVSTKSISNIGKFMRGGPNRKVSSNGEFTMGTMHGKNF